jgi:hypothetical protein
MTPGTKTEICNFSQDKRRPKRRWTVIKVHGVTFQKRSVLIGDESQQLGMLLTALDSKRNGTYNAGAYRFPRNLGATSKFSAPDRWHKVSSMHRGPHILLSTEQKLLSSRRPGAPRFEHRCRSCFFTSNSGRYCTCQVVVTLELYPVLCLKNCTLSVSHHVTDAKHLTVSTFTPNSYEY